MNENFADQTVATLYQNDDFGKTGRDAFVENVESEPVAEETYESTATDINSQLANLRTPTRMSFTSTRRPPSPRAPTPTCSRTSGRHRS